ncbi:MAG: DUF1611 domain-containing protein [Cyclobacteriaceae bacterium]|nr:DUF1611 domain-containing protein [Cyclobacteriaceae bacterium]
MNRKLLDGNAIVYAEGAYNTHNGKTAHGLVRFTNRYHILSVVDSRYAGQDAGLVLDGIKNDIPIFGDVREAIYHSIGNGEIPQYMVIGLAPDGGRLDNRTRNDIKKAIMYRLHIDCGLHDFLTDIPEMRELAEHHKVRLRDIRKTPSREDLHFFTGNIEKVNCLKLAVLGTDSAIGKRTTAWLIVQGFVQAGCKAELIGTGQTAWMQGARYAIILDSLINDFVSGEIENAVYQAWKNENPDVIVIEGQGSLLNPAYPGGFEILAAGRPDFIILQHAPRRREYDGFPRYPLHPLGQQINAIETISGRKVIAITLNHEEMALDEIPDACSKISGEIGLPVFDVLAHGPGELVNLLSTKLKK